MSEALTQLIIGEIEKFTEGGVEIRSDTPIKSGDDVSPNEGDIVLDSLDAIDLLFALEKETGVEIEAEKLADILPTTPADLAQYIKDRVEEAA